MKFKLTAGVIALLAIMWGAHGADDKPKSSPLDSMKSLAGEWVGTGMHGDHKSESTAIYKVTAGGSAVMETLSPGTDHEMVTMYYLDGDDLVMTHYCMLHNQPHMKAEKSGDGKKLTFKFAGGTNIKPETDTYMRDLTVEFIDANHVKHFWTMYEGGKKKDVAVLDFNRKKN